MSLVNDLIIEVDRRNRATSGLAPSVQAKKPDSPIDGLASPRRTRPSEPPRDWLRFGVTGFAVVSIVAVAIFLHLSGSPEAGDASKSKGAQASWQDDTERSAVSAARPSASASSPVVVRSVSLSKLGAMTRIRIATDSRGEYRIEGAGDSKSIRIVLTGATLAAPMPPLDLVANGLRSWQLVENDQGLVIQIEVPQAAPVQSQWIAAQDGAALFIDLTLEADDTDDTEQTAARNEAPSRADAIAQPPKLAPVASPGAWIDQPAIEASAGSGIERSADDYDRTRIKNARNEAERVLSHGRFARSEGDLPAAAEFYASGLAASPGHRALTLERTRLLVEMNQPEEALQLIRDARREAPRDVAFAMLHARLLERMGDLPSALAILEESPFEIGQAPEIFALAAAYFQKSGDHASAIERYEALVRRFPERSGWWMGLGISLDATARSKEALDVYKIALELGALPEVSRSWVSGRVRSLQDKG